VTDTRDAPPGLAELTRLAPAAPVSLRRARRRAAVRRRARRRVAGPVGQRPFFDDRARARARSDRRHRAVRAGPSRPVIGITGTNGKSTVTTLVAAMANAAGVDGPRRRQPGTPGARPARRRPAALYVLELSSYQLETTDSLELVAATVLNLSPDHLDRYGTMRAYAAAKARIFSRCRTAVVNADDADGGRHGQRRCTCACFSLRAESGADYRVLRHAERWWLAQGEERLLAVDELKVTGLHNAANALAALALGEALGLPRDAMLDCLRGFAGLPHRAQWVGERRGVRYVNDSKGTNVGATLAAVAGLRRPAAGDRRRRRQGPGFHAAARRLRRQGAPRAADRARCAAAIAAALGDACPTVQFCASLEAAVVAAAAARRCRATRCCCRRPARASTCSATMRTAATCSPPPCRGSRHERRRVTGTMRCPRPACGSIRSRSRWCSRSCCSGLIMVTSASISTAARNASDPFFFAERQLVLTLSGSARGIAVPGADRRARAPVDAAAAVRVRAARARAGAGHRHMSSTAAAAGSACRA
jgi:UDP-N-acetylmuramoylalanine--D-glutamate ligase